MSLHRIILSVPFIRHYAGSVFELHENPTPEGWDPDERLREKISFLDKRNFMLPDNGKGSPANLSFSDTIPCPATLFDGVDLRTGPCRITSVQTGAGMPWNEADATLFEIAGQSGQGIQIRMGNHGQAPFQMELTDVRENRIIRTSAENEGSLMLDFSDLGPGFYQLDARGPVEAVLRLRFIKCFPLVALFKEGTTQIKGTMKTIY